MNSIDPSIWGPNFWNVLYYIAYSCPKVLGPLKQLQYYNFFKSLTVTLPCESCRLHYKQYFVSNSIYKVLRKKPVALSSWVLKLHNTINARIGKQPVTIKKMHKKSGLIISHPDNIQVNQQQKNNIKVHRTRTIKRRKRKAGGCGCNKNKNKRY
jgi:hypothetical protein